MQVSPIRFGVLGTGRITRRLIADLQSTPATTVTAIASRSAERAKWQADSHGIAAGVEGYDALLRRDDVDAVYIALPPSLHHQWTLAACAAGKHVLCEKPIALSADQVADMLRAAEVANVRFLDATAWLHHERTDQFRRWLTTVGPPPDPAVVAAKKDDLFSQPNDSNENDVPFRLGRLRHISASVSFPSPFQSGDHRLDPSLGGGALLDLGWYAAGLIRFAFGGVPEEVYADAVMRDGIISRVSATMRFAGEVTATLSCGFDTTTRKWFEIAGEEASIVCDDFTRPWAEKPARSWVHEASGKVHTLALEASCLQEREMIARLGRWIRLPSTPPPTSPPQAEAAWRPYHEQALQTQMILDALDDSIQARAPVKIG